MERNWSEAVVRHGSRAWRWAGAVLAALAMTVGVAPAFAADANYLTLNITQSPNAAIYGASATYTVTLKNTSNKTVNNAGITVTAPAGSLSFDAPWPSCALSTGLPCAAPVRDVTGTVFNASGYQLPSNATLTITVGYYMPAAPPASFILGVTGTSSNNAGGPNPSAYTTVSTTYTTVFAPPPPLYPNIQITFNHDDSANALVWSTADCDSSNLPDCGTSYYGQYKITVTNADSGATTRAFNVLVSSSVADVVDSSGCSAPCGAPTVVGTPPNKKTASFTISAGLVGSTSFTVSFKTPLSPVVALDVTASTSIDSVGFGPSFSVVPSTPLTDAAIQTYASLLPANLGGSAKAKNSLDPLVDPQKGPFTFNTRVDVPKNNPAIDIKIIVKPGTTACSSSSPQCLDTDASVQDNTGPFTFGGINQALNGTDFLVITMFRDWTTLAKKPSSVFNATVWYTDDALNRTVVKDCGSVDLTLADRCVSQRIDMTTSAKGVITGGYLKFIIWARHNGGYSW